MSNTSAGKAFEFACAEAVFRRFAGGQEVVLSDSDAMRTGRTYFEGLPPDDRKSMRLAADAGIRIIEQLEPRLSHWQEMERLEISLQTDASGISGDVRDVLCLRGNRQGGAPWVIGISCKHNHHAVKHSRLSQRIDFGREWLGYPCSVRYFTAILPVFQRLEAMRRRDPGTLWRDLPDKVEAFYRPVLEAFRQELLRLDAAYEEVPFRLVQYLLGRYDFYKVISEDRSRLTRVEIFNLYGTLGKPAGTMKALFRARAITMPSRILGAEYAPNSEGTLIVYLDKGWSLSMRIHNASSRIEPSLKFDVQLVSMPSDAYNIIEPWKWQ